MILVRVERRARAARPAEESVMASEIRAEARAEEPVEALA